MKKFTAKVLSVILVLSMVLELPATAFATEYGVAYDLSIGTQEDITYARNTYNALDSKAKVIFEKALARDPKLLEFHKTYVDPNFTTLRKIPIARVAVSSIDPMTVLSAQLATLGLPSAVVYSLKAMGAGMVAAIADGPLPVGDILLAAATASTAVVIAANWDTVSPKFNRIVSAFQKAFSSTGTNISSAFTKIKSDAKERVARAEINQIRNNIPKRLLKSNGDVDISRFNRKKPGGHRPTWMGPLGWYIQRDTAGHGGRYWKLFDYVGKRIASLAQNGKILSK
ncbi:hypothetical protein [Acetivibrio ethanolgignens]|uniref:Pre-toxin TG domain-containing protein n=1 Tax=Acetivibrio ethanolgignens TaxID=290052 RepID=A0A0V8QFP8_9FIRM|nr:hypothetical protein [Acetivibrio ethanolgignens]KSV59246.1 hypothetical protein ASU35_10015 [Acetivibrio ethanolgignens]